MYGKQYRYEIQGSMARSPKINIYVDISYGINLRIGPNRYRTYLIMTYITYMMACTCANAVQYEYHIIYRGLTSIIIY